MTWKRQFFGWVSWPNNCDLINNEVVLLKADKKLYLNTLLSAPKFLWGGIFLNDMHFPTRIDLNNSSLYHTNTEITDFYICVYMKKIVSSLPKDHGHRQERRYTFNIFNLTTEWLW
jgi:hypothetical protein